MYLLKNGNQCVIHTPAKLNLHLEVLPKRSDGYHEISTLMVPIRLYDTLVFQNMSSPAIRLQCLSGSPRTQKDGMLEKIPQGRENLVVRAVELIRHRAGIASGAMIQLVKRIPSAAGLGGGSSDAAAALAAANHVWGLHWSRARLRELAAELGSDVPFFLGSDNSDGCGEIGQGRGEQLSPVDGIGQIHFAVAHPPEGLSTARVFANCEPAESKDATRMSQRLDRLIDALRSADLKRVGALLHNRLEQAAAGLSPWIARLRREFERLDVFGHLMSGSGSSYFGICRSARHARLTAAKLQTRRVGKVYAACSCRLGLPVT